MIAGAVVIALVVRTFLFTTFWIPSGSMEPTLMGEGRRDRVVVNRLAASQLGFRDPAHAIGISRGMVKRIEFARRR